MNRFRAGCAGLCLMACLMALPVAAAGAAEADPADVNDMLKQMIRDLAQVRAENESLQAQLKAAKVTVAGLDAQNRELDETNRRLRAVLRDLAARGFPVYEVLGQTASGTPAPKALELAPEIAQRLKQLLETLADAPQPRADHKEDWDWSPAAQSAREELAKLGVAAVDGLLGLAARSANPVVKMRAGVILLQIRQQTQALVAAKVLDVGDRNDLVAIGLGENQGVAVGQMFLLMRGNTYVGQSKVTRVWGDLCVAQALDRQEAAQVGDQALALIDRTPRPTPAADPNPAGASPPTRPLLPGEGAGLLPAQGTPPPMAPPSATSQEPLTPAPPQPPKPVEP